MLETCPTKSVDLNFGCVFESYRELWKVQNIHLSHRIFILNGAKNWLFYFIVIFWLYCWHVVVPGPGTKPAPEQWLKAQKGRHQILNQPHHQETPGTGHCKTTHAILLHSTGNCIQALGWNMMEGNVKKSTYVRVQLGHCAEQQKWTAHCTSTIIKKIKKEKKKGRSLPKWFEHAGRVENDCPMPQPIVSWYHFVGRHWRRPYLKHSCTIHVWLHSGKKTGFWKTGKDSRGMMMHRGSEETEERNAKSEKRNFKEVAVKGGKFFLYYMADDLYKRSLHMLSW